MKHIRLEVACRYVRRYTGAATLECAYKQKASLPQERRYIVAVSKGLFIPKQTHVFLKRGATRIAEITQGLPEISGRFDAATGAFRMEIPY